MAVFATAIDMRKYIFGTIIILLILGIFLHKKSSEAAFLNRSLVAYWSFEDAPSNVARDRSGNGNNGTLTNGPKYTNGRIGQALAFDESNDYVGVGNAVVTSVPLTMCAWFKVVNITTDQALVWIGDKDVGASFWGLKFSGTLARKPVSFRVRGGGVNQLISTATGITSNTWHHACAVSISSSLRRLYLDGREEVTGTSDVTPTASDDTNIGRFGDSSPSHYNSGLIDEVRIYNRALSENEIRQLYLQGKKGRGNPTGSLSNPFIW